VDARTQERRRVRIHSAAGKEIASVDDWLTQCPPKRGLEHWVDGRSAKELAKAWFRTGVAAVPEELVRLFDSHELTRQLVVESVTPECVTVLDDFPGENRNHDLVLSGRSGARRVVVGIEGKADEAFGEVLGTYYDSKQGTRSNVPRRIEQLVGALFGSGGSEWRRLRYQLVHGCAATLIEANLRQADVAVFLVHEFLIPGATKPKTVKQNSEDWATFLRALDPSGDLLRPGGMSGPFKVPGGGRVPGTVPLLVGKVSTS
jgi:hypothetical protein